MLEQGDAYGERRQRKKRSEPLRAAQEAYAAVMAAASMAVPELLRCEMCQVSSSRSFEGYVCAVHNSASAL